MSEEVEALKAALARAEQERDREQVISARLEAIHRQWKSIIVGWNGLNFHSSADEIPEVQRGRLTELLDELNERRRRDDEKLTTIADLSVRALRFYDQAETARRTRNEAVAVANTMHEALLTLLGHLIGEAASHEDTGRDHLLVFTEKNITLVNGAIKAFVDFASKNKEK